MKIKKVETKNYTQPVKVFRSGKRESKQSYYIAEGD